MRKRICAFALALLMVFSLAACGGSNGEASVERAPAEAEEAKACSHDWAEASCKTPRTCLICGETEGEITDHYYGHWEALDEAEMLRACTLCGETETAALDRETMFRELIVGNWDFHSSSSLYGDTDTYTQTPYMSRQLWSINEPDWATYRISSISSGSALVYEGYEKQEEGEIYNLRFEYDDGSGTMPAKLICTEEGNFLSLIMEGMGYAMLSRNDEREHLIPGRYVCGEDYIELHADRSVTGNIGGEVKGYWVLKPVISTEAGLIFGINVNAQRGSPDDSDYTVFVSHDTFLVGQSIEELENFSHDKISISFFEEGYTFLPDGAA